MGAVPDFAPIGQNHLMRSTSVVQKVVYDDRSVQYRTFDPAATEALRLHFKPARITAADTVLPERNNLTEDGFTIQPLQGGDFVVRVRHSSSGEIKVSAR